MQSLYLTGIATSDMRTFALTLTVKLIFCFKRLLSGRLEDSANAKGNLLEILQSNSPLLMHMDQ